MWASSQSETKFSPRAPQGTKFARVVVPLNHAGMSGVRLIKHEAVPQCGSYEVRYVDGRPARYFYWDDMPSRRLRPDMLAKLANRPWRRLEQLPRAKPHGEEGFAPPSCAILAVQPMRNKIDIFGGI